MEDIDFPEWAEKIYDQWKQAREALDFHNSVPRPEAEVAGIIWDARKRKLEEDFVATNRLSDITSLIETVRALNEHGEIIIRVPGVWTSDGYGLNIRTTW